MAHTTKPGNTGKDKVENLASNVGHFATDVKNKAQAEGANALEKAKDVASTAASKAGDLASNLGDKAEDAVSSVGGQMKTWAGSLRENAPHEGMIGSAADAGAKTLDRVGSYLQEQNLSGMADDMTNLIRRYPIQALLVGMGVGFLFARATRS